MSGTDSSRRMCASIAPHIRRTGVLDLAPAFDRDRDFRVLAIVTPCRLVSGALQPINGLADDWGTRRASCTSSRAIACAAGSCNHKIVASHAGPEIDSA